MNKSNLHVLIVDDDEATNFICKWLFEKKSVASCIQIAFNGKKALEYILQCHEGPNPLGYNKLPDLILLDINMPVMDGWEFLEKYAELPNDITKGTIIICMLNTFNEESNKARLANSKYIAGFTSKPLTTQALDEILTSNF